MFRNMSLQSCFVICIIFCILVAWQVHAHSRRHGYRDQTTWLPSNSSDEEENSSESQYLTVYKVSPRKDNLKYLYAYSNMLCPLLDAYMATVQTLQAVVVEMEMLESQLVSKVQTLVKERLESGEYSYGETIAADPIKNCLKMLEGEKVVEVVVKEGSRYVCLTPSYDNLNALQMFLKSIEILRP